MVTIHKEKEVVHCSTLFDPLDLIAHIEEKFVSAQSHPNEAGLRIYNYTNKTTFENKWDEITLACRGLILDKKGNIVARPFQKFFNLNTMWLPDTLYINLPNQTPVVLDKLDGSLGIYYETEDKFGIATRGSFQSDQAKWATEHYEKNHSGAKWPTGYTPLFEIIYNQNRIVVQYPFEGLVLIGLVDVKTGREADYGTLSQWAKYNDIRVAQDIHPKSVHDLMLENIKGQEGYVLTYDVGDCPPLKLKIKFADYCKLHKILTDVNIRRIWEGLKDGIDFSPMLGDDLPKSFTAWVKGKLEQLQTAFDQWETIATDLFESSNLQLPKEDDKVLRKQWAKYFQDTVGIRIHLLPVLFAMLDGRDYRPMLWKALEPKYDPLDKPFVEE